MIGRRALIVATAFAALPAQGVPPRKPLMRDFIGLNVHTVQFRPELYAPVARRLRDYHGFDWDVGDDTSYRPKYPMARNGVNWEELYGGWRKHGYSTSVCLMFDQILPPQWKDLPRDAEAFGEAFARYFGPSHRNLAECIEIGNEPGKYDDPSYRLLLESTGKGIRRGDPKLKIATCAIFDRPSGEYHKSLDAVRGLEPFYDVLSLHSYAFAEQWPTWRRSYPEDPSIPFLKDIRDVIAWRDRHARGKEVWLTEFGWDASTKPPAKEGTFRQWVGVTDAQQARYIVRAYLAFSAMDLDRAYLYWFNDNDEPSLHAASGLTRGYQPKPSFHAVAHLQRSLGEYRFERAVVQRAGELYLYQYRHGRDTKRFVWVAWSPTGTDRSAEALLPKPPGSVTRAARMPLKAGDAEAVAVKAGQNGRLRVTVGESPAYIWLTRK